MTDCDLVDRLFTALDFVVREKVHDLLIHALYVALIDGDAGKKPHDALRHGVDVHGILHRKAAPVVFVDGLPVLYGIDLADVALVSCACFYEVVKLFFVHTACLV